MSQPTKQPPEPVRPRASLAELLYEFARLVAGREPASHSIDIGVAQYCTSPGLNVYTASDAAAAEQWRQILNLPKPTPEPVDHDLGVDLPARNWQTTGTLLGWPVKLWHFRYVDTDDERYALTATGEAVVGGAV